jgi:hypothetical protein
MDDLLQLSFVALLFLSLMAMLWYMVRDVFGHPVWRSLLSRATWRFGMRALVIFVTGLCVGIAIHAQGNERRVPLILAMPMAMAISWALIVSLAALVAALNRKRPPDPLAAVRRPIDDLEAAIANAACRESDSPPEKRKNGGCGGGKIRSAPRVLRDFERIDDGMNGRKPSSRIC